MYLTHSAMQTRLQSQKTWIQDYVDKIAVMEKEMEKVNDLFSSTKNALESTTKRLNVTKQMLDERDHLLEHRVGKEAELFGEASTLLNTVGESVADVDGLHSKLDRTEVIHAHNKSSCMKFDNEMAERIAWLRRQGNEHYEIQNKFYESMNNKLGEWFSKVFRWLIVSFTFTVDLSCSVVQFSLTSCVCTH